MRCQIIPLNPLMLCWSCWSRMWYHGWLKWERSLTIILKSRGMCFKIPLAIKTTNRKNHQTSKKQKKASQKQPSKQLLYYLQRAPRFSYLRAPLLPSPWNAVTGALHRALWQKMECPVWELATSVRKLLQMVQLISCQNSEQTSSESMGTSLGLNVKLASCSVSLHFLQNVILNHFC